MNDVPKIPRGIRSVYDFRIPETQPSPQHPPRPLLIFFRDSSKQLLGTTLLHVSNILFAMLFASDDGPGGGVATSQTRGVSASSQNNILREIRDAIFLEQTPKDGGGGGSTNPNSQTSSNTKSEISRVVSVDGNHGLRNRADASVSRETERMLRDYGDSGFSPEKVAEEDYEVQVNDSAVSDLATSFFQKPDFEESIIMGRRLLSSSSSDNNPEVPDEGNYNADPTITEKTVEHVTRINTIFSRAKRRAQKAESASQNAGEQGVQHSLEEIQDPGAHFLNTENPNKRGDQCDWYWINIVVDTTLGVLVAYQFLKLSEYCFDYKSGWYLEGNAGNGVGGQSGGSASAGDVSRSVAMEEGRNRGGDSNYTSGENSVNHNVDSINENSANGNAIGAGGGDDHYKSMEANVNNPSSSSNSTGTTNSTSTSSANTSDPANTHTVTNAIRRTSYRFQTGIWLGVVTCMKLTMVAIFVLFGGILEKIGEMLDPTKNDEVL